MPYRRMDCPVCGKTAMTVLPSHLKLRHGVKSDESIRFWKEEARNCDVPLNIDDWLARLLRCDDDNATTILVHGPTYVRQFLKSRNVRDYNSLRQLLRHRSKKGITSFFQEKQLRHRSKKRSRDQCESEKRYKKDEPLSSGQLYHNSERT